MNALGLAMIADELKRILWEIDDLNLTVEETIESIKERAERALSYADAMLAKYSENPTLPDS